MIACPPLALLRLELWGQIVDAPLPSKGRAIETACGRLMWIEPRAYLLRAALADLDRAVASLEAIAGDHGAVFDLTGGLACFRLTGPGWRELLTIGGVFDVEDPAFEPGCVAATILHHAPIWIDVIDPETCDVYCPPSYGVELAERWAAAIARTVRPAGL
jgi:heterotetrameric sarcosine oxidase gamma subunit